MNSGFMEKKKEESHGICPGSGSLQTPRACVLEEPLDSRIRSMCTQPVQEDGRRELGWLGREGEWQEQREKARA